MTGDLQHPQHHRFELTARGRAELDEARAASEAREETPPDPAEVDDENLVDEVDDDGNPRGLRAAARREGA
jgi:hypothetical protein